MEVIGKIKIIGQTESFGENGFRKRDMVVTTDEQYPQMLSIQFQQDKCDVLNNYQVGQDVKIQINLRGREWINPEGEAKYFNTIVGWRIENLSQAPQGQVPPPQPQSFEPSPDLSADEPDDLPF